MKHFIVVREGQMHPGHGIAPIQCEISVEIKQAESLAELLYELTKGSDYDTLPEFLKAYSEEYPNEEAFIKRFREMNGDGMDYFVIKEILPPVIHYGLSEDLAADR